MINRKRLDASRLVHAGEFVMTRNRSREWLTITIFYEREGCLNLHSIRVDRGLRGQLNTVYKTFEIDSASEFQKAHVPESKIESGMFQITVLVSTYNGRFNLMVH